MPEQKIEFALVFGGEICVPANPANIYLTLPHPGDPAKLASWGGGPDLLPKEGAGFLAVSPALFHSTRQAARGPPDWRRTKT